MAQPPNGSRVEGGLAFRLLRHVIDVRSEEVSALAWSWLYFFSILSATT